MPLFAKPAEGADESFEDPNKRAKIMLIVLAGVVVIAALFWFLVKPALSKSDSKSSSGNDVTPSVVVPTTPSAGPSAKPTVKPTPTPTTSFMVNDSTRDPFAQLAFEIKSASPSPSVAPKPSATAQPSSTPTPSASPSASSSHSLTLLSISGTTASLTVDGKTQQAKAGDTLASGVSLMKVTDDAVFVTFGSKAYAITIGQTVNV